MHKYLISAETYQEILEAEKATKSKRVSKKLNILLVRFGAKNYLLCMYGVGCNHVNIIFVEVLLRCCCGEMVRFVEMLKCCCGEVVRFVEMLRWCGVEMVRFVYTYKR